VTNSRDTQELLPEAGQEMLRIFHTHPARTSLLQDFAFYEVRVRNFTFNLAFIPRVASSDAENAGASTSNSSKAEIFPHPKVVLHKRKCLHH
jgi:hypothetical protein